LTVPYHQGVSEPMDIYDRVAAWAAVYALENPNFISKTHQCISWAVTLNPFIQLAFQQVETRIDVPEVGEVMRMVDERLGDAGDYLEMKDLAEYAETVNEWLTGPDQSVEIGGPKVEAEIAEIRKLQDEQEKVRADQAAQVAEFRDQLAKKYEDSPEQEKHLKEFDNAAKVADDTLVRQQAAELQKLQEQQLQRSNPTDPSRDR
jgi:hypothetical protein